MSVFQSPRSRLVLILAVLAAGMIHAHRKWIRPLDASHQATAAQIDALRDRLEAAQAEVRRIKERQHQVERVPESLRSLHENPPSDPAIVWIPARLKSVLARFGLQNVSVQLNKTAAEPALSGYERSYWYISIPQQGETRRLTDVLLAVAQIEQADRFVKIRDLSLRVDTPEPGTTMGFVNVSALMPR